MSSLKQVSNVPAGSPIDAIQVLSWNDYESGNQIEAGVDNCVSIIPTVSADTLTWQTTGNTDTIDHYAVYASTDGTHLTLVAQSPATINSIALDSLNLAADTQYTMYVQAVGKPSVLNKVSTPASYWHRRMNPPTVQLTVSPASGVAPLIVNASFTSSGAIKTESINFGDGASVSSTSGSHSYSSGTYTVKATVTDSNGASASAVATVTVTAAANQPPIAKLSVTPTSGTAPLTVSASTSGSTDPDGTIASTRIDFGDGTLVSAPSGSHTYSAAGTYIVKATVTDNGGLSSSATATVTATAAANQPPIVKLSVTPTSGTAPLAVSASTAGSSDPDGTIASTKIDFGDGTVVSATSGSHTYSTAGTYVVKATVTDNGGLSSSATSTVAVTAPANQPPIAKLSVTPTSGTAPLAVSASTAGSTDPNTGGSIASSTINFGDGTVVNAASGSHTYATAGTYTITATVTGKAGLSSSTTTSVAVSALSQPFGVATHGMTIPAGHPRLWAPAGSPQLATVQSWFGTHPYTPSADQPLQLGLAYLATGTASYCTSYVIPNAMGITLVDTAPSSNGSDSARDYGETLILAYDWCYAQMTPTQRSTLIANVNGWFQGIQQQAWGGPTMPYNNYFWGSLRNELEWAVASYYENTPAAEAFLDDALNTRWTSDFLPTESTSNAGGVTPEGTQYGRYLISYGVIPFVSSNIEGRDLYDAGQYFKEVPYYLIYTTTPAVTNCRDAGGNYYELFPFSDDENWYNGNSAQSRLWNSNPGSYYGNFMQTAANYWPSINTGRYAQQWINTVGLNSLTDYYVQAFSGGTTPKAYSSLPLDYYATGMQMLWARKAWDTSSTVLHIQMGMPPAPAHHHFDFGNWQMWRGGYWVSRETTSYSETFTGYNGVGTALSQDMIMHNGVLINPDSQGCTPGTTCYGNGWSGEANAAPTVNRLESQGAYTYADVDLTPSARNNIIESGGHPERDNPAVGHVEREYVFVRSLETLVILDRLQSNPVGATAGANIRKTFVAHCEQNPKIEDATHITCTNGTQALRITTLLPTSPTHEVVNEANAGDVHGQYRIEINDSGSAQSYLLHVLQAMASGDGNIITSVVDSNPADVRTGTFTVTLTPTYGSATTVVFNKGKTSNGGTINVAGTGATGLRSDVQPITYGDAGPAWQ